MLIYRLIFTEFNCCLPNLLSQVSVLFVFVINFYYNSYHPMVESKLKFLQNKSQILIPQFFRNNIQHVFSIDFFDYNFDYEVAYLILLANYQQLKQITYFLSWPAIREVLLMSYQYIFNTFLYPLKHSIFQPQIKNLLVLLYLFVYQLWICSFVHFTIYILEVGFWISIVIESTSNLLVFIIFYYL